MQAEGITRSARLIDHARRRLPWVLFVITTSIFLLTATHTNASMDVVTSNLSSWQLATGTRPYLDGFNFSGLDGHPGRDVWIIRDSHDREIIGRSGGPVLLALPEYAASKWVFGVHNFSMAPGAVAASLAAGMSVALLAATLRPYLGDKRTILATVTFAFATPVWSVTANAVWPQTVTVLGICAMAWAMSRGHWWLAGIFGGVVLWGRVQAAILVAIAGLVTATLRRHPQIAVRIGVTSGIGLGLLAGWSKWMYGSWNPTAYYNPDDLAKYAPNGLIDPANQLGSWVSPDRGILVWTPILIVLLPVLVRHWRRVPDWSRALAVAGIAYTVFEAMLIEFPGGDSFYGYRMTLELLVCLTPAISIAALHVGRWGSALIAPLIALQFVAISIGAVGENMGLPVSQVWRHNSFLDAAFARPAAGVATIALVAVIAFLGRRIWNDPVVRRSSRRAERRRVSRGVVPPGRAAGPPAPPPARTAGPTA